MATVNTSGDAPTLGVTLTSAPVTMQVTYTYTGPPSVPSGGLDSSFLAYRINGGAWYSSSISLGRIGSYTHSVTITPGGGATIEWFSYCIWWDGSAAQTKQLYSVFAPGWFTTAVASCTASSQSPADGYSSNSPSNTMGVTWTYAGFPAPPSGGIVYSGIVYRVNGGTWSIANTNHSPYLQTYSPTKTVNLFTGDRVDWYAYATYYDGATFVTVLSGTATAPHYFTIAADSTGPTISARVPADAASTAPNSVNGVDFYARATDTWGIASMELYVDGGLVKTWTAPSSGSTQLYTHPLAKGAHTWYVKATDANGNVTTDSTYNLTVTNAPPTAPSFLLLGGVAIASATTRVSAVARLSWSAAADYNYEDSITYKIEVSYNGGGYSTLVASQAGLTYDWTPTTTGTATIRITSNDGTADCTTPLTGSCTVGTGTAPNNPTLTDPGGFTFVEGSTQSIAFTPASPVDPDAGDTVTYELEFSALGTFADAVEVASGITASPYAWTLAASLVAADTATCKLRLRARDNYQMVSAWSTSTAFTVQQSSPPTITIVSPAAAATTTNRLVPLIVEVADSDAGDKLHVAIEVAESADYAIGVIAPDTATSQLGWESSPSPYTVWSAFPSAGCDPGDRVRYTPTTNLRYDLYYYRARVTDTGGWVSDWVTSTFRVSPAPGSPLVVTIGTMDFSVSGLKVTERSGTEPSSMEWTIPSDVWSAAPQTKGAAVSCAINVGGTARTWSGTLEDVKTSGAYAVCLALMDDAYLGRKLATGDEAAADLGQNLADFVTSYGSPLTGTAIDTSVGVTMALTGAHKTLGEHFSDALKALGTYMLWVDSTGDIHFQDQASLGVPTYLLKES